MQTVKVAVTCRECGSVLKPKEHIMCADCERWRRDRDEYRVAFLLTFGDER